MTTADASTERRDALVERLFEAVLGFNDLHAIYLGDRLGLYRALSEGTAGASFTACRSGARSSRRPKPGQ